MNCLQNKDFPFKQFILLFPFFQISMTCMFQGVATLKIRDQNQQPGIAYFQHFDLEVDIYSKLWKIEIVIVYNEKTFISQYSLVILGQVLPCTVRL